MYIETPRMIIRGFTPEDAADLHEILGDEKVMANCEPAYDYAKTERFLADFCIGCGGGVAAVHRESGKVVGYILFNALEEGVYEMGWFINRNYWRQGIAFESCKAVIDYAFAEMGVHKIFAETIDCVKSVSLMKKLGMRPEGIQRSQTRDNHGNWADLYFYGLLEEYYREGKQHEKNRCVNLQPIL